MKETPEIIAIKNRIIEAGNAISQMKMTEGLRGFAAAGKKQWQLGYLQALTDVMKLLEE